MWGRLLRKMRAGEEKLATHRFDAPAMPVTSNCFTDGAPLPHQHVGSRMGGSGLSPHLAWPALPEGTRQILVLVEDIDVPLPRPMVHLAALVDADITCVPVGAFDRGVVRTGVRLLRAAAEGYYPPEPIKGHGPHRYVFQVYALDRVLDTGVTTAKQALTAAAGHVLAVGALTGTAERD